MRITPPSKVKHSDSTTATRSKKEEIQMTFLLVFGCSVPRVNRRASMRAIETKSSCLYLRKARTGNLESSKNIRDVAKDAHVHHKIKLLVTMEVVACFVEAMLMVTCALCTPKSYV